MTFSRASEPIELRPNSLWIFKRLGSPNFYCKVKIRGIAAHYYTCGTSNEHDAAIAASDHYNRLVGLKEAGKTTVRDRSFKSVAEEYLRHAKFDYGNGKLPKEDYGRIKNLAKLWIAYFWDKHKASIRKVNRYQIDGYFVWRRKQGLKPVGGKNGKDQPMGREPADTTIIRENNFLRAFFKYALRMTYLDKSEVPHIPDPKGNRRRRPSFSEEEWARISNASLCKGRRSCMGNFL